MFVSQSVTNIIIRFMHMIMLVVRMKNQLHELRQQYGSHGAHVQTKKWIEACHNTTSLPSLA